MCESCKDFLSAQLTAAELIEDLAGRSVRDLPFLRAYRFADCAVSIWLLHGRWHCLGPPFWRHLGPETLPLELHRILPAHSNTGPSQPNGSSTSHSPAWHDEETVPEDSVTSESTPQQIRLVSISRTKNEPIRRAVRTASTVHFV